MAKKKPVQEPVQPATSPVKFSRCKLFNETWDRHRQNPAVVKAFAEFVAFKQANPLQPFGAKDRRLNGDLGAYIHAGLTYDVSLIYKVSGRNPTVFFLYAIATHDEAGTAPGSGANQKRQQTLAKRMDGQDFE